MNEVSVTVLPDGRLDRLNAAKFLGLTAKTLSNWQLAGKGPPSRLVGSRRYYNLADLRAWVSGRTA